MKTTNTILIAFLSATVLSACANLDKTPDDQNTQTPNPAAVFCANEGGSYNMDNGNCRLEDGTVVNGWDYYREHHPDAADQ